MITWTEGDLFASGLPALAHGVNCRGVMGAGIAAQFRQRWPGMYESYRRRCRNGGLMPGEVFPWDSGDQVIYNLATQDAPGADARPWMITAAVGQMISIAVRSGTTKIAMPLIGCGIGGLTLADLRCCLLPYADAPVDLVVFEYRGGPG